MTQKYDVAVIGSGPGGYVAAGRAAQLGYKTAIIEKESLGGVCLNWGCIPTKALLECAHAFELVQTGRTFGFTTGSIDVDFPSVIARSREVADRMSKGIGFLMKQRNVAVYLGEAELENDKIIKVMTKDEEVRISADHIVLALGAKPISLPGISFDGERILHFRHAMTLSKIPKSMIVIGAGAIGMEFADFYRTYGAEMSVIEMLPNILPNEDEEIIKELSRTLRRKKIQTYTNTKVADVKIVPDGIEITAQGPRGEMKLKAEKILIAIGVRPNSDSAGLEKMGVVTERGFVKVDSNYRTNLPGCYAIGDLIGPPMLAHKASAEGLACINAIAKPDLFHPVNYATIPGCTYCKPQVASVGLTEKNAIESGLKIKKGVFPFRANGMSIAMNETEGIVKLIFNAEDDRLIGAHILHAHAGDLIGELCMAIESKATARDIAETVHAHPTLAEAVMEAAAAAIGEAVHI